MSAGAWSAETAGWKTLTGQRALGVGNVLEEEDRHAHPAACGLEIELKGEMDLSSYCVQACVHVGVMMDCG